MIEDQYAYFHSHWEDLFEGSESADTGPRELTGPEKIKIAIQDEEFWKWEGPGTRLYDIGCILPNPCHQLYDRCTPQQDAALYESIKLIGLYYPVFLHREGWRRQPFCSDSHACARSLDGARWFVAVLKD